VSQEEPLIGIGQTSSKPNGTPLSIDSSADIGVVWWEDPSSTASSKSPPSLSNCSLVTALPAAPELATVVKLVAVGNTSSDW